MHAAKKSVEYLEKTGAAIGDRDEMIARIESFLAVDADSYGDPEQGGTGSIHFEMEVAPPPGSKFAASIKTTLAAQLSSTMFGIGYLVDGAATSPRRRMQGKRDELVLEVKRNSLGNLQLLFVRNRVETQEYPRKQVEFKKISSEKQENLLSYMFRELGLRSEDKEEFFARITPIFQELRDRALPTERYAQRSKDEDAISFFERVWGQRGAGGAVYLEDLEKIDPDLITGVRNRCKYLARAADDKSSVPRPEEILPPRRPPETEMESVASRKAHGRARQAKYLSRLKGSNPE